MIMAYILVVLLTPFVVLFKSFREKDLKNYFLDVAIGFDQAGGSALYRTEDWTVSSWTHYLCKTKNRYCWFEKVIDFLFGKGHCKSSYLKESREGMQ